MNGVEPHAAAADLLICGLARSGTSLMRGLFAAHPAYAVPRREMTWWVGLYPRFRGRSAQWQAFLATLVDDARTQTLGLDRRELASDGLHPSAAAHRAWARALYGTLKEYSTEEATGRPPSSRAQTAQ